MVWRAPLHDKHGNVQAEVAGKGGSDSKGPRQTSEAPNEADCGYRLELAALPLPGGLKLAGRWW